MINKFQPYFLQRIDQHLLTHYPVIWQTRIHWIAFYTASLCFSFMLLGDWFDHEPSQSACGPDGEEMDMAIFFPIPLIMTLLATGYWLHTQHQQKIDYSKLSSLAFLGVTLLNYLCISLIFLPVTALVISTLDYSGDIAQARKILHALWFYATPIALLPFIIRHFRAIEMLLVFCGGIVYAIFLGITLNLIDRQLLDQAPAIFTFNYLLFGGFVVTIFKRKSGHQTAKRWLLYLVFFLPLVMPALFTWVGYFQDWRQAYEMLRLAVGVESFWLHNGVIAAMLITYGLSISFFYKSLECPPNQR